MQIPTGASAAHYNSLGTHAKPQGTALYEMQQHAMHQYQRPLAVMSVEVIPARVPPQEAAQIASFATPQGNYIDVFV
jgi:hypothetical protein